MVGVNVKLPPTQPETETEIELKNEFEFETKNDPACEEHDYVNHQIYAHDFLPAEWSRQEMMYFAHRAIWGN